MFYSEADCKQCVEQSTSYFATSSENMSRWIEIVAFFLLSGTWKTFFQVLNEQACNRTFFTLVFILEPF